MATARILVRADNGQFVHAVNADLRGEGEVWPVFVSFIVDVGVPDVQAATDAVRGEAGLRVYVDFSALTEGQIADLADGDSEATVPWKDVVLSSKPNGVERLEVATEHRESERWAYMNYAYLRSCRIGQSKTPDALTKVGKPEKADELAAALEQANAILLAAEAELKAAWLTAKADAAPKGGDDAQVAKLSVVAKAKARARG